jgi:uncharacterized protein YuzE
MMKVTYDKEVDAAYIYLDETVESKSERTKQIKEDIILDFDKKGQLIGIEVLNAKKQLPKRVLEKAELLV